jgi:hypothetical protein
MREGRYADARNAAMQSLGLGANLSPERVTRAELALCLSQSRMGLAAEEACDAPDRRTRNTSHLAIRLESCLALAEARLALSDRAGAAPLVAEAGRILSSRPVSEHRWRFLALSVVTSADSEREAARKPLTRELEQLRLKWGEANFESWRRRADVTAVLKEAIGGWR